MRTLLLSPMPDIALGHMVARRSIYYGSRHFIWRIFYLSLVGVGHKRAQCYCFDLCQKSLRSPHSPTHYPLISVDVKRHAYLSFLCYFDGDRRCFLFALTVDGLEVWTFPSDSLPAAENRAEVWLEEAVVGAHEMGASQRPCLLHVQRLEVISMTCCLRWRYRCFFLRVTWRLTLACYRLRVIVQCVNHHFSHAIALCLDWISHFNFSRACAVLKICPFHFQLGLDRVTVSFRPAARILQSR